MTGLRRLGEAGWGLLWVCGCRGGRGAARTVFSLHLSSSYFQSCHLPCPELGEAPSYLPSTARIPAPPASLAEAVALRSSPGRVPLGSVTSGRHWLLRPYSMRGERDSPAQGHQLGSCPGTYKPP